MISLQISSTSASGQVFSKETRVPLITTKSTQSFQNITKTVANVHSDAGMQGILEKCCSSSSVFTLKHKGECTM